MKLNNLTLPELKAMSYTDIAYMILQENKKTMKTPDIFKRICELLGYSDEEYTNKIGDFYASLTTDCRFIILSNAEWDLRDKHVVKMVVEEEDDEETTEDVETEEEDSEEDNTEPDEGEEPENIDADLGEDDLDDSDDELDDLAIIDSDDEELEEN